MKVYDTANKLAKEIRESEEYIEYKKMKEIVCNTLELKEKIESFTKARYQTQVEAMKGQEPSKEQIELMQRLYMELIQNDVTKRYLEVEIKFNTMLADINKILGESVQEVME